MLEAVHLGSHDITSTCTTSTSVPRTINRNDVPISRHTIHTSTLHINAQQGKSHNVAVNASSTVPPIGIPTCPFEKHFDPKTGRYYYIHKETGESIWDVPSMEVRLPLSPPSATSQITAAKEARQHVIERARLRQDRINISENSKREWRIEHAKTRAKLQDAERKRQLLLWQEGCKRGAANGDVRLSWQRLGYVSPLIYSFEKDMGRPLTKLCIEGNNLDSIGHITQHCLNLVHLSLVSNNIRAVGGDIANLTHLRHLNLLRNQLETLPNEIGTLKNLTELEVASNSLEHLPTTVCDLQSLMRINAECNKIQALPESIGRMIAEELNFNSNALVSLPSSITKMPRLRKLCVNDNKLTHLPLQIGNLGVLQILHASKNCLSDLPPSMCRIGTLENLWLDYNNIAALPSDFHQLRRLKELNMEGNPNMVLPPVEKLVEGAKAVLRWSACRYASSKNTQQRSIIMSLQDILRQVSQNRELFAGECRPLESVFEETVDFKGYLHYQFLPEAIWTVFLPKLQTEWSNDNRTVGIRSFSYQRREVERALLEFRDAAGKVAHHQQKAFFRCCSCQRDLTGRKACGRVEKGWACQRPALLLRMSIIKERDVAEKRQKNVEIARINAAVESAERIAKRYLSLDEGKQHIRSRAEERVVAEALSAASSSMDKKSDKDVGDIASDTEQISISETNTTLTIGSTVRKEIARKAATMKIRLHPGFGKKVHAMEEVLRIEYINTEADKRRKLAEESNRKMKTILRNWLGMSLDEAFCEWRDAIKHSKRRKKRDVKAQMKAKRLHYESNVALEEYAKRQLALWEKCRDEYNDMPYWLNSVTNESTYHEPTVETFLPEGWDWPPVPEHIFDKQSGEMFSHADIQRFELDSDSSSDDYYYYDSSLDDYESSSVATSAPAPTPRPTRVSFLLPNEQEEGEDNVDSPFGVEGEALSAAHRVLKKRRQILLKKRRQQQRSQHSCHPEM